MIVLRVDGKPVGKGRPRFGQGRTYTDRPTELAEARFERAWEDAGKPRLDDGPLAFELEIVVARPQSHWRKDGTLGAAGRRAVWPCRKPDADNALKLGMDALNGKAYRDDVDVVHAWVVRRWANAGETEHCIVRVRAMPVLPTVERAA